MINYPLHLFRQAKERLYKKRTPLHVSSTPAIIDIEPTIRCNLKCEMCQTIEWDRRCEDLSYDNFQRIVNQLPSLGEIKLQGMGEPLLNNDFFRMVDYAKSKGIKTRTISNGTLIDGKTAEMIISSGLEQLHISLDGASPKTYEGIRKGASFSDVIKNIERLVEARGSAEKPLLGMG